MNAIAEFFVSFGLLLYYILESAVLWFVPKSYRYKNINGQRVLITGAGSGLGRLMSERFAKLYIGCTLVLWDINEEGNEETASHVKEFGVRVLTYKVDLSKREDIYRAADKVKNDLGDIDILVNNAGIVTGKNFLECPDSLIQKTMDVNATAHFWTVKSFLPAMLRKNKGHIVTIASLAGHFGGNGLADYSASKFAAFGFDESLRAELAVQKKTGVHTTCVCPYFIDTGMFSGASTKFPSILPILKPEYVVDKIMDAVLINQAVLCIPKFSYWMIIFKNILPTNAFNAAGAFLGFGSMMDNFRGRAKTN